MCLCVQVLASTGGKGVLYEVSSFLTNLAVLFICKHVVQVKQHFFCDWNLVPVELMLLLTSVESEMLHDSLRSRSQTQGGQSLDKRHCRQSHF